MKGTYRYVRHISVDQPDGRLGLPETASPEYTDAVVNCTYTLACLHWLASTLIEADKRLHTNDPVVADCKDVLSRIQLYSTDPKTGIMVGQGMPFAHSHRHWSHLFMIYPFHEYRWDDPEKRRLMQQSLDNWTANTKGFAGYSWIGASLMYANAGNGDKALDYLHAFLQKSPLPNTLYREGNPVIETPLAAARAVQEMLMTSGEGTINVFPAVPTSWRDAAFADMRAEGAFLVSALRGNGVTRFVRVTSLAGEPLRIRPGLPGKLSVLGNAAARANEVSPGVYDIDLAKGVTVTLTSGGDALTSADVIAPVAWQDGPTQWGGEKPMPPAVNAPVAGGHHAAQ
jgi:hypothetical protein